jgi:RNA ligase
MTLFYPYPKIEHIHDVLAAINGSPEFSVTEKDGGYTCVRYQMIVGSDTFPTIQGDDALYAALRRECRGLLFDTLTGKIISRPYEKFFNLGERADIVPDLTKTHRALEKLDGSMIRPILMPAGYLRWGTKAGITDKSLPAETYVALRPEYVGLAEDCIRNGLTPIFEWLGRSKEDQIVIDHKKDALILTAIRHTVSGRYMTYPEMVNTAAAWNVPVVKEYPLDFSDLPAAVAIIRALEGEEGVVIRWDDGHMVKLKSDWYTALHRAKAAITQERTTIQLILNEKTDDLIPILPENDVKRLAVFTAAIWHDIRTFVTAVFTTRLRLRMDEIERKDAKAAMMAWGVPANQHGAVYAIWDLPNGDVDAFLVDWAKRFLLRYTSSNTSLHERAWQLLLTARWAEKEMDE